MTYQEENDKFLLNVLDKAFFINWTQTHLQGVDKDKGLQLNITYACNQNCSYCYLIKHGEALYPHNFDQPDLIKKNLKIILDWFSENYPLLPTLELFSGEIWHTQFGLDILDIILEYRGNIQLKKIVIPSNMSFILDPIQTQEIQNRINAYATVGINLQFSASVDGLYLEDFTRERIDKKQGLRDELFYDNLFKFLVKNHFGAHPMLSAYAIEHWKENYVWWYQQCSKYGVPFTSFVMLLEVRNNDWTPEKIEAYKEFLDFQFHFLYREIFKNDKRLFTKHIFGMSGGDCAYQGILLGDNTDKMSCTISNLLTVRLGDLAICPCHRTCYPQFLYGNFVVEDEKIIGIHANNIQLPVRILCSNMRTGSMGCDSCMLNDSCIRQCYGSCYESNNDLLLPLSGVCEFFHQKYYKLFELLEEHGLIDELINDKDIHNIDKQRMLKKVAKIKESYEQWKSQTCPN